MADNDLEEVKNTNRLIMIFTKKGFMEVQGELIDKSWAITPEVTLGKDGEVNTDPKRLVITHTPSGQRFCDIGSREKGITLLKKIKSLDLCHDRLSEIMGNVELRKLFLEC